MAGHAPVLMSAFAELIGRKNYSFPSVLLVTIWHPLYVLRLALGVRRARGVVVRVRRPALLAL